MRCSKRYQLGSGLIMIAFAILWMGCRDQPVNSESEQSPSIYTVRPLSGKFGSEVEMTGINFSQNPDENTVLFNGTTAEVIDSSPSRIVAKVPKQAGSGPVKVIVNGGSVQGPDFTYLRTIEVSTYAGSGELGFNDGEADQARFYDPVGLELSEDGRLFVADYGNHSIRAISPDRQVTTLAGNGVAGFRDEVGRKARFNNPIDIQVSSGGSIIISDFRNHRIRKISPSGMVTTLSGHEAGHQDGRLETALFRYPAGIVLQEDHILYVSDSGNNLIRAVYLGERVETIAGNGSNGFGNGFASEARFYFPFGLAAGSDERLIVADHSNHRIRHISSERFVSTISGNGMSGFADGTGEDARLHSPYDVAVDDQDVIYVADYENHSIRMVTLTGNMVTLAGNGSPGWVDGDETEAQFKHPIGLAVNRDGTVLYVADHHNQVIRKITME